jgi:ribose transport system ATP-binding protein
MTATTTVPALTFDGIGRSFFGVPVLSDVSLSVAAGRVLGLIGQNGAGKSTLMNILGGVLPPDSGVMRLYGEPYAPADPRAATARGVAFIHQELNLFTNLSIAENLFITGFPRRPGRPLFDRRRVNQLARAQLERVGLDVDPATRVERLSVGERQLVEIAKALGSDARLIIFDEPTTSLTHREAQRLFSIIRQLRAEGRSVVYISHVLGDVAELCDDIVVLRDGRVVGQGPRDDFPVRRMISLMVGRTIDQLYPDRGGTPPGEPVLELDGVSQRGVVEDVSMTVRRHEIVGVFGLMGSGRTELARIVFGLDPFERGSVTVAGRRVRRRTPRRSIRQGMAFVTENRREEGLLMDLSITDNIALAALSGHRRRYSPVLRHGPLAALARRMAESLNIRGSGGLDRPVRGLSGGNQQKVVVAKWLATRPSVFILDEPTRGVDVGAKQEVYGIISELAEDGAGVLVISSELEELMGLCDRIVVMAVGEVAGEFDRARFSAEDILAAAFREAGR